MTGRHIFGAKKQFSRQELVFFILFCSAIVFSVWKCKYGFGGNDEAFYLTIPHRLTLSDSLLTDEWHVSQLSGLLLFPLVRLYVLIFKSTDGILLFFRYLYIAFHTAVSVVLYLRLKKFNKSGAAVASLLFYLFTPYNIMALSYNTMGLDLMALTCVLLSTMAQSDRKTPLLCGVLFSGAVLCNPYLALVYLFYTLVVFAAVIYLKAKRLAGFSLPLGLTVRSWFSFSIGVIISAAAFLLFLFSRTSVSRLLQNLPFLLKDPEHAVGPTMDRLKAYVKAILNYNIFLKYALPAYLLFLIIILTDRKRAAHRYLYLFISSAFMLTCLITFLHHLLVYHYNAIMFAPSLLGLPAYLLANKKEKSLFALTWIPGILYSVCMSFSSNQYFYVISMALAVSDIAAVIFIVNIIGELRQERGKMQTAAVIVLSAMLCFQLGVQLYAKAGHVYKEPGGIPSLTATIQDGPAKGITTTSENAESYGATYRDIAEIKGKGRTVLFATKKTWCYLADSSLHYGTFSAWLSGETPAAYERLLEYYRLHPDKIPDYIYIPKDSQWDLSGLQGIAAQYGYTVRESDFSYKLEKAGS